MGVSDWERRGTGGAGGARNLILYANACRGLAPPLEGQTALVGLGEEGEEKEKEGGKEGKRECSGKPGPPLRMWENG